MTEKQKIDRLIHIINRAIRYIEDTQFEAFNGISEYEVEELLDILKGNIE